MNVPVTTRPAGFTLVEAVVSSTLLALLVLALSSLASSGSDAQQYAQRLNRATEVAQEIVDQMRTELVSSVRIFGNDAEGNANVALVDLVGAPAPLAGSRLPTLATSESVRADTLGAEITGNSLLFARLAWNDRFQCTSGNEYLVDVYRWYYYYLTPEEGGPAPGRPIGLNLVRIVSEPLIDAASIDRIDDPDDLKEMLLHLAEGTADASGVEHDPCVIVWQRGALPSVAGTFRMIDADDGSLSDTPIGSRPDPWNVLRSESLVTGLLSYRHHSVATNHAPANFGVARYGLRSTAGAGFPHGFEVQAVGPSSARQVLLHLVVSSTNRRGQWAWSELQVSADTRDQ